jgi:Zn-dependent protease/CBS domain-containing protein
MFSRTVRLIEIFGFQVKIDASWLFIAFLVVWSLMSGYFPAQVPGLRPGDYLVLAIIAMVALFAGLILHELAHSLVARRFGLGIGGITLFIFGGVAELDEEPVDPRSEFWIAIAGPAMSFALAGIAYLLLKLSEAAGISEPLQAVLEYLAFINLVLALFNLLPAFPLDGGRMLRAALWHWSGDLVRATRSATGASAILAYALIALGFVSLFSGAIIGGFWQALIGLFLLSAARGTYQQLMIKTALRDKTVASMMSRNIHTASPEDTLTDVVDRIMLRHSVSFVPVTEGEHLLGFVDTALLQKIDRDNWGDTHIADIYVGSDPTNTITPDVATDALMARMASGGRRKFLVAEGGRFMGVITLADLMAYLAVLQDLGQVRSTGTAGQLSRRAGSLD